MGACCTAVVELLIFTDWRLCVGHFAEELVSTSSRRIYEIKYFDAIVYKMDFANKGSEQMTNC